ncbi:S26 family signal peptidase [Agrobacterium tumefaciens]|uniref:S26 family signal peptidase n=1 Tax=Agrobacterium tumefaciens TaxID=358 RepID=A0AA44JAF6_AGRTU|nr:S26 family signal peptidase [Agrobacterium tumefaciens]NTB87888.1 S26 family signal peptidase [Agrobacterium tumefaciens]NTC20106.1 S26 family signal peptidase [Agrobacterium tumefaciens]NTC31135.1 S26 family signal peptidase [Agrobacterium tumefaciens]|tara:strand:+ start:453 stop:965 length:513 start_codon:yes stop_codon:yes gene_type:complete
MKRARPSLIIGSAGIALIAFSAIVRANPILVWNASASVPIGFYAVQPLDAPNVGDLVVLEPPSPLGDWLLENGYLGADVPLIKHVAALPGQRVCRVGLSVSIDGVTVATAKTRDRLDRSLPVWQGCQQLTDDQIFFLNPDTEASLDGRYFGPLPRDTIVGRAVPIWTRED